MKKVMIIGENSYIGRSFEKFAENKYNIKITSSRNNAWESVDFTGCDVILHCAGIAHIKQKKKIKDLYYRVNCDLAVGIANKAKNEKVKQFIFLSSMAVYGTENSEINKNTLPNQKKGGFYGGSKLKAEQELEKLSGGNFKLCIVRPPMVYGKGCGGNFPRLVKLARATPIFPDYQNKRSMIYIDNLCACLCNLIDGEICGIILPQNKEYVNTTGLVKYIAESYGKRIRTTKLFNPLISLLKKRVPVLNKLFGDLTYAEQEAIYDTVGFYESIDLTL